MSKEAIARLEKEVEEQTRLTAPYERALGNLSIRFSLLHSLVEEFAWRIWGLNSDVGAILTKDLPTKQLVKKLRDSAKLFFAKETACKDLIAILNKVEDVAGRRNEFLHSIWVIRNGQPIFISRKRGRLLGREAPSAEDINDLSREIMSLVTDFMEIRDGKSLLTRISESRRAWDSTQ
jgi:hypothetical protein